MFRFRNIFILLISSTLVFACSIKSRTTERIVSTENFIELEQVELKDMISVYTNDEKELIMYISYFDDTKIVGYVTAIHDERNNSFEFFDENEGITKHIKEIPFTEISSIGLYERSTSIGPSEGVSKHLRCISETAFFGFTPAHCYQ